MALPIPNWPNNPHAGMDCWLTKKQHQKPIHPVGPQSPPPPPSKWFVWPFPLALFLRFSLFCFVKAATTHFAFRPSNCSRNCFLLSGQSEERREWIPHFSLPIPFFRSPFLHLPFHFAFQNFRLAFWHNKIRRKMFGKKTEIEWKEKMGERGRRLVQKS